jgi:hypothetical protein
MVKIEGSFAQKCGTIPPGDVVEIGLLVPTDWAQALIELSHQRQQSVGQLLRSMINHELQGVSSRP